MTHGVFSWKFSHNKLITQLSVMLTTVTGASWQQGSVLSRKPRIIMQGGSSESGRKLLVRSV